VKKAFCFSFPPENSHIKDRKSRCQYQNNLLLKLPMPEKLRPENPGQKLKIRPEIAAFLSQEGDFLHSHAGKVKAGKSQQATTDTAGKSRGQ
jgi:hypothetical protein